MDVILNTIPQAPPRPVQKSLGQSQQTIQGEDDTSKVADIQNLKQIVFPQDKSKKPLFFINFTEFKSTPVNVYQPIAKSQQAAQKA